MTAVLHAISGRSVSVIILMTVMLATASTSSVAKGEEELPLDVKGPVAPDPWQRYSDWTGDDWAGFNTLSNLNASPPVAARVVITEPITGNPENGRELNSPGIGH